MPWSWRRIFAVDPVAATARRLYEQAVDQAREPVFYMHLAVPDTVIGRFDLLALHVFMLVRRVRDDQVLAQALCNALVDDLDRNMREMGVGDLSVGRKVRGLAEGFYGRAAAYDNAVAAGEGLDRVLQRNLYGGAETPIAVLQAMEGYFRRCLDVLAQQPDAAFRRGECRFAAPPGGVAAETEEPRP